jgi:hypothetical protein
MIPDDEEDILNHHLHNDEETQLSQLSINTEALPTKSVKQVASNTYQRTAVIETFPPLIQIPRIIILALIICSMLLSPVFYSNNSPWHTEQKYCYAPPGTSPEITCVGTKRIECTIHFNVTVTDRKKIYSRKFAYDCPPSTIGYKAEDCFFEFLANKRSTFKCAPVVSVNVWPQLQSDQMRTLENVHLLFRDEMIYAAVFAGVTACFAFVVLVTLQCNTMRHAHKYNTIFSRVPEAFKLDGDDPEALYIVNFDKEQYYSMKYIKAYMKRGSIHVSPKLQSISPIYKLNIHPSVDERAHKMFKEHSKYYKLLSSTSIWHDESIVWMQKVHKSHGYSSIRLKALISFALLFILAVGAFVTTHSIIDYRSMYVLPFISLVHIVTGVFVTNLINYIGELRCDMVVTDRRVILAGNSRAFWNSWIKYVRLSDVEDMTCVEGENNSGSIQFNSTQEFISAFKKNSKMKSFILNNVEKVNSVVSTVRELMDADAERTEQSVTQLKFDAKEIPEVWIEDIDNYGEEY